jgi:serine/threonine protein phosphatase 1
MALLEQLPKDTKKIFTGDLIDRGPKSKEVVEWAIKHPEYVFCQGNHEQMMVELVETGFGYWLHNGGWETIKSFGIYPAKTMEEVRPTLEKFNEVIKPYIPFFKSMPLFYDNEEEGIFVSHSAYNRSQTLDFFKQNPTHPNGLTWYRGKASKIENRLHVFGHTPLRNPLIEDHCANIDTGCCYNQTDYDKLTAIELPSKKIYRQKNPSSGYLRRCIFCVFLIAF